MADLAALNARIQEMTRAAAEKQGKLQQYEQRNESLGVKNQTSTSSSGKGTTQKTQTSTGSTGADAITQAMEQRAASLAARAQELNRLQEDLNQRYAALQSGQSTETAQQLAVEQDRLNDRKVNYERDSAQYGVDSAYYDTILSAAPYIAVERQAEKSGTQVSGGVQALIDTMQQRVNQIDQRRKEVQEEQAALEERARLLQYNTALTQEEREAEQRAINQAVANLTTRQQNLMRDAGVYSEDARTYDDALIEQAERDMMDFATRQMDAYYEEAAMAEAYEGQKSALYAEWQELNQRELQTGVYGERTASDVWDEYMALDDEYQDRLMEAESYWAERELEKLSDSERKLVEDYVEANRTKGTANSGRYAGVEEVEKLWNEMMRTFGTQRAKELVQWGERAYDAEQQAKRNEKLKAYAQNGVGQAIAASAASVITNFASAPGAVVEIVRQKINNPNNLQTLNVNAPGFEAQNATRSFRSGVTESIMPDEKNATAGQKTGVKLYSDLMSIIDSLVASRLPGKLGGALLGATAATNTAQDITERGGTMNQALLGGVAAGAFEMIFESVSIGQLKAMEEAKNVRNVKTYLLNVAKSVGTNASEEAATEMANILFDMVALGDVSDYQMQLQELMRDNPNMSESEAKRELAGALALRVVESGVSGALMGGVFGVFGNTVAMKNTKEKDGVYNELILDGLIDQGLTYEGTTAFELAASLQIRRNENEVIPHEEITALMEQVQNEVNRRAESGAGIAEATNAEATEQMMGLPEQVRQIEEQMKTAPEAMVQEETVQETDSGEDMNVRTEEGQETGEIVPEVRQEETRKEVAAPTVQEDVREESPVGNIPARGVSENAAEGVTEENALRQEAERELRGLAEEYQGEEFRQEAQNLANDMRMAGDTAYAEAIEAAAEEMIQEPAVVSANNVRTAPESAVQTEGVQYGGAETAFDGGRERDAGAYTGGSSGILGERADGRKKRSAQNKRAAQRQTRVHDLRAERVSAKSLGIALGSDLENVTVVPEAAWDGELQATAERIWEEAGLEVQYILGKIRLETSAGTRYAKGAIVDGKIIIQADNLRYTVDQIADHEMFHDIARGNRGLVSAIREEIQERYSREEYEKIVERYLEAYAGVYENDEDLLRKIAEEIFADAYAGINEFSERVETYRGVVREITDRRTGRMGDRGTPETRAGPEDMKNAPAEAEEGRDVNTRFSLDETDSDGNALSEEQAEYFADSKARDDDGNLLVVYHGTNADKSFTVFNTYGGKFGLFGRGSYFTDNLEVAESYTKKGRGQNARVYSVYLNIKRPLDMDDTADVSAWKKAVPDASEYFDNCVSGEDCFRALKEYCQDEEMLRWEAEDFIREVIENMGFDGITHIGGGRYNKKDDTRHRVYIAFEPEQIKNTTNSNPTENPDIRFTIDAEPSPDSPGAEAVRIWEDLRGTYGTGAILDGVVNGRIQELREQGETETATVLNRIWRAAEETVAPATEYDDRGERWTGEVKTIGEAEESLWTEVDEDRLKAAREQAKAEKEARLQLVTRENFTATPAVEKLGVRIEGSVADYGKAESLRRNDAAAKETRRQIARTERRINATAKEKEFASGLAAGVYDLEDIPNTMSPDHVVELADLYSEARSLGLDMIKERRREINGQLDEVMQELFHDSEKYKPMTAMQLYHNTPQRIMQKIFGDKLGDRINREIFDPVSRNEAERLRFMNRQFDRVRTFRDSKGRLRGLSRAESALTQQIIEGRAVAEQVAALEMKGAIEDAAEQLRKGGVIGEIMEKFGLNIGDAKTVERYARWLDAQEAMKSGKVDAVKVENAADEYRKIFDEYYEAINDFLVVHGYEPIGFIKGYAPHMQSDESKDLLEKALKTLGIQTEVAALPTTIAGLTSEYKPGKRWNPYFLSRHTDQTDYDIESAFESYVNYMSDVLYHTDDIMRVRRMSRYFRKSYSPEEIKGNIDWAESLRYAPTEDKMAFLRDMKEIGYGTVLSAEEAEQMMEAFIESEFQKITENTKFGDLVSWLDNYANILAGKQSVADRGFEAQYGRKLLNWGRRVSAMFSRANVAGNISSALNQSAQLPQIVAENGTINTLKAIGDIVSGKVRKASFAEESDFLTGKRGVGFLVTKPGEMVTTALFKPAEFVDGMLSTMAVRGAYHKAVRQGMSHEEAMRKADRTGQSIMASRVKGVKPMAFESKNFLAQMVNMFQVEALNSWQHLAQDLPRDFRDIAETKGRGKAAMALSGVVVKTLLGAFLMNRMTDELYGGTPAPFDLAGMSANFIASGEGLVVNEMLRMLIDNVWEDLFGERPFETERRDPEDRPEFDWDAAWKDLWYEVSNEIPYLSNLSGLLGWGDQTLPLPDVYGNVENLITAIKNAGWVSAETGEAVIKLIGEFFPGGRQMTKTAQGVKVMLEGGRYYGYGDNRRLQYPVEGDAENWIKAVLFGYSSLSETNNFYASGVGGLSEKQTKVYEELIGAGYDSGTLYETLQAYNAAEDSRGERAAITEADLTDRQKLNLYTKLKGDSREEEFVKLMNAGLSWAETMEAYDEYAELYNEEEMSETEKATRYAMWVDEQGYDDKQAALIKEELVFFNFAPAKAGNYEKFTDAGLSIKESFNLATTFAELEPEDGKSQVSDMQKYWAIVASGMDENEQLKAIGAIMGTDMLTEGGDPSQYAKMLEILDDGTTITEYLELKDADHVDAYLKAREKGIELETYVDLSEAKQVDNYLEAVELGLSKDSAYKAVMAVAALPELPEGESYGEKDRQLAAVKACESVNDQILAYAAYGDKQYVESTVEKLTKAYEACGLTPEHYAVYRISTEGLDAKDANGKSVTNLKKARVIMAIDQLDLSVEQKNYLFDMAGYKGRGEALWNINRKFDSAEAYAKWL